MPLLRIVKNNTICKLWVGSAFTYISIHPGILVVNLLGLDNPETGIIGQFCRMLCYFQSTTYVTPMVWNSLLSQAPVHRDCSINGLNNQSECPQLLFAGDFTWWSGAEQVAAK